MRVGVRALLAILALSFASRLEAQQYFGQNQVQYKHFTWRVLETEHFLVHYYPEERKAVIDAARMAERSYARLSRILGHQFREKKPIILFASRADFAQNNVTGDLGEGVGGVTESQRHRLILPLTGDLGSFEHVLAHEMVHEFQYDIFSRGRAGANQQQMERLNPPLWFMEGMAEYLSIGPNHPLTAGWLRDAAVNGKIPTIEQMTDRPDEYFPYRYGESLWQYVGERWGDQAIGEILRTTMSGGVARAFQRELGMSLEDLSSAWREAVNSQFLPAASVSQRPRTFAQPLLTHKKSGGEIFLAPVLSNDGKYIAFLSNGNWKKGEVFIDLWLGNARTGERIKRLVKSTTDPNFEELRLLYSQSAFSNDGRTLAFTAMREGKDVLYLLDIPSREVKQRVDLPLDAVTGPTWSPDDKQIAFSGTRGGITDIFIVDRDGKNLRALTNDLYGDLQPSWSPDGKKIAFATDRGPPTNFSNLQIAKWQIGLLDVQTGTVDVLPNQAGLNLNPVWAPDGGSVAYISDRTGIANVFLFDLANRQHYQLTNVLGGVSAITEYSPAITWARGADKLAFTYYENGDYTVWEVDNPRSLKTVAFDPRPAASVALTLRPPAIVEPSVAAVPLKIDTTTTTTGPTGSVYRAQTGTRPSMSVSDKEAQMRDTAATSVATLNANADFALPDTTRFKDYGYRVGFKPDYIAQPEVGYGTGNQYGLSGFNGGTTIVLSDLLGNHQIAVSASLYGQLSDASLYAAYANLSHRWQYSVAAYQQPVYLPQSEGGSVEDLGDRARYSTPYTRYVLRNASLTTQYPFNRFSRFEAGLQFNSIGRSLINLTQDCFVNGCTAPEISTVDSKPALNFTSPSVAYVSDNSLLGLTGPIMGRRYRFQITPSVGNLRWTEYLADYRRYDPIVFNTLTFATRFLTSMAIGRDEGAFPKYVGRPEFVRGYDNANFYGFECTSYIGGSSTCNTAQLVGSRVAVANAELRFPLIRRFDLGSLPIGLPPVEGLIFYDAGLAWNKGQTVSLSKPDDYNFNLQRYPLRSYGVGIRVNLFNIAILKWDYAKPLDSSNRKANWTFSLGPSF
ncbi:MAG TPA: BamA/TamA family outer membrane protein [Gemmatimonadaceae bacterium]|nr:BamA/TamA family outer membrane protein [Gemmatimonadaceae bacterium]